MKPEIKIRLKFGSSISCMLYLMVTHLCVWYIGLRVAQSV